MKVAVWPSLVGISICWSIMAVSFRISVRRFFGMRIDTIARNRNHDKARDLLEGTTTGLARPGLERRGPDRHCLIDPLSTLSQPTGDSHDDPDQQSVF